MVGPTKYKKQTNEQKQNKHRSNYFKAKGASTNTPGAEHFPNCVACRRF